MEDLHVEISAYATPAEAHARIAYALAEVRRFLVPVSKTLYPCRIIPFSSSFIDIGFAYFRLYACTVACTPSLPRAVAIIFLLILAASTGARYFEFRALLTLLSATF